MVKPTRGGVWRGGEKKYFVKYIKMTKKSRRKTCGGIFGFGSEPKYTGTFVDENGKPMKDPATTNEENLDLVLQCNECDKREFYRINATLDPSKTTEFLTGSSALLGAVTSISVVLLQCVFCNSCKIFKDVKKLKLVESK